MTDAISSGRAFGLPTRPLTPHRRRNWRPGRGGWVGLAFVAPAVALFAVFGIYPVIFSLLVSFARWDGFSNWIWVGLKNYADLLGGNRLVSPQVEHAALITAVTLIVPPVIVAAIGLALAMLLNSVTRLRALFRTVYFLPFVTTGVAVFSTWRLIYEPDGVLNAILNGLGLHALAQPNGFLGTVSTALGAVMVVGIWGAVPLAMLLYLTGLQTIPDSVIDAARVDGATGFRLARSVILPLLNPITALIVILQIGQALQNFQIYLLMTNGGPVDATNTLGLLTYGFAFGSYSNANRDFGYAGALGWLLGAAGIVLAVVNLRILRSRQ